MAQAESREIFRVAELASFDKIDHVGHLAEHRACNGGYDDFEDVCDDRHEILLAVDCIESGHSITTAVFRLRFTVAPLMRTLTVIVRKMAARQKIHSLFLFIAEIIVKVALALN